MTDVRFELVPLTAGDAEAVHALTRRWEAHWRIPIVTARDEIEEELTGPHFRPDLDSRGVWAGGRLVAFGAVFHTPSAVRQVKTYVRGMVDPGLRGNGIGRRLLSWQIERSADILRMYDPALPRYVRAYEWDFIDDAHHLYRRLGMGTVRWFEDMIRPLVPAVEVEVPDGVAIVGWGEVESETLRHLANDAFADHWGSTPRDRETWEHDIASSSARLDLSVVALVGDEPVGYSLNGLYADDEAVTGRRDGWIFSLGVARGWRRRGIAAALIASSVAEFRRAGMTHAMLGVDSDNPSGAAGLYTRLGFTTLHRTVANELEVPVLESVEV